LIRADVDHAREAAEILRTVPGAVLLVPTETVYGLICRADDPAAVEKIYRMKHRDGTRRLGVFVSSPDQLNLIPDEKVRLLVRRHCPGALTIIARRIGGGTIGFRIPDHRFLAELLRRSGMVLAQTSANRSGMPDARTPDEALSELAELPDMVIDGGPIPQDARASTVVDASGETLKILRQGNLLIPEAAAN